METLEGAARALVDAYLDALAAHDHDAVRRCLSDRQFCYVSPIARYDDPDDFTQFITLSGGILQGIERRRCFVDGADVCHWLVFVTQLSERVATRVVQWAHVEDGRITSIELLFDAHRYRQLFDVDGTGPAGGTAGAGGA